jgi:hypothetical protein
LYTIRAKLLQLHHNRNKQAQRPQLPAHLVRQRGGRSRCYTLCERNVVAT